MSTERTPLLAEKIQIQIEEHHREQYESDNLHDQREHHLPHHNHHNHSPRHHQPTTQEGDGGVEAGRVGNNPPADILIEAEKTTDPYTCLGFSFSVLAGICFTSSNVMVKYLPAVSSWELLFVRCLIQMVAMVPLMICFKRHPLGPSDFPTRGRVFAQGVLGGILLLCIFEAVADLPLGDATAIFFSSPAFTMVLSTCILRDHCGLFRTFIAISLLSGVVILSRPPSIFPPPPNHHNNHNSSSNSTNSHDAFEGGYNAVGLLSAVGVPILSALIVIITRQAKHVHYSVLVFWFAVGGFIVSLIGMYCIDKQKRGLFHVFMEWNEEQWVLTFLIALVGLIGSILMTKAVCWVTPSKVMVVRSFEVVVAYILQVTVFDTPTHLSDVFGTILVILAVLSMGLEDPLMRRFRFRFL
eukprot:TRINITY_DN10721_c0_g1_i1.p1 TRINITY_DN10721_c0_g1~~TRINITY_DN10721_c0_g1_i1.p1  ORF type:complete len:412 (+),score=59.42 TRINITY_DN10721_c0_g1_i1:80-1315(+)